MRYSALRTSRRWRRNTGGILLITLAVTILIAAVFALSTRVMLVVAEQQTAEQALESAALVAAKDLAKIVVLNDQSGYISLSDFPPIGKATLADDGEPLPVTGINTLMGTARLDTIVAHRLGNQRMEQLAHDDACSARSAASCLVEKLNASLQSNAVSAVDQDGNSVNPYQDAKRLLVENLGKGNNGHPVVERFELSLGSLNSGGTTQTPMPNPTTDSQRMNETMYKPFINIRTFDEDFHFAALSQQSMLVEEHNFMPLDKKRICSIVKADAWIRENGTNDIIHLSCCAQPGVNQDITPAGVLVVSSMVPSAPSLGGLLNDQDLQRNQTPVSVASGDFPVDRGSSMQETNATTAQNAFAECIYGWIHSAHLKPRLDELDRTFNMPLNVRHNCNGLFMLSFDSTGQLVSFAPRQNPFPKEIVLDKQSSIVCPIQSSSGNYTLVCHNQVACASGKHRGQPLAGTPLNWCDLSEYGGGCDMANNTGRGGQVLGLKLDGPEKYFASLLNEMASSVPVTFRNEDEMTLSTTPRKCFYGGGETGFIELAQGAIERDCLPSDLRQIAQNEAR